MKSRFLGIPILFVGVVYLALQLVAFAVFMAEPTLPVWAAVVVSSIILGISAICMIAGETGKDEIGRVEEKVNRKVFYIRELQADVELLAEQEQDAEIKQLLMRLAEKIRYSDPMSSEALADLEGKIKEKVSELKTADNKPEIIAQIVLLLSERNKKNKTIKMIWR